MKNATSKPDFIGDGWCTLDQGLSYLTPMPEIIANEISVDNSNPWHQLLYVFEQAKKGNFKHINLLLNMLKDEGLCELHSYAIRIIGLCAPVDTLKGLSSLVEKFGYEERVEIYDAMRDSGQLFFVEDLLKAKRSVSNHEKQIIKDKISDLLEEEPGMLVDCCEQLSDNEYEQFARKKASHLEAKYGSGKCILQGKVLDINFILNMFEEESTFIASLDEGEIFKNSLFCTYVELFEAMTGISAVKMLDEEILPSKQNIQSILKEFRGNRHVSEFPVGSRVFFCHNVQ